MSYLDHRKSNVVTLWVPQRVGWIDGARGLSIFLMVWSHVDLALGSPLGSMFHLVWMRPVAPVFLMLFAMLWRPGFRRRHLQLIGGAVVAQLLTLYLFGELPNILVVLVGAVLVMPLVERYPVPVLLVAVNQLAFWPLPDWWTGYPVGLVLVFLVAGRHVMVRPFLAGYGAVGAWLGMGFLGRYPMSCYVGHLAVLAGLVWVGVL